MRHRTSLLTGTALAVALSSAAMASPRTGVRPCLLLSDPAGDAHGAGPGLTAPRELDLRGANEKLEGSDLVVTIMTTPAPSAAPTLGEGWSLRFSNGESAYVLQAVRGADGPGFSAYGGTDTFNLPWLGDVGGRVDLEHGTVTIVAPLDVLKIRGNQRWSSFDIDSMQGEASGGSVARSTPLAGTAASSTQSTTVGSDAGHVDRRVSFARGC